MYKDISVQLVSLIYIVILSLVYFLKRKYNFLESKVYKSLLLSTIVALLLDIVSMYIIDNSLYTLNVFSKLYFISLFVWLILFIFYVLLNKTTVKYDNFKSLIKKSFSCKCWLIISFILFIVLLFSKINYMINPIMYYGFGVLLVYYLGIIGSLILLVMLLFNSRKEDKKWKKRIIRVLFLL